VTKIQRVRDGLGRLAGGPGASQVSFSGAGRLARPVCYDWPVTIVGAVFLPQCPPERLREVAVAADEAGLEELWLWEDCFREGGVASAAAALAWTGRLSVGVGLLPVPLRNVALTAMEVATLCRLFPGRVRVAVGHGNQVWMRQAGALADSPVTLFREYVTALRALLRGEEVSTAGRYVNLDRVALAWPPEPAPAVVAGGWGPRSLRLCGEVADGTILSDGTTPDGVRRVRELAAEGRAAAGRRGPHPVTVYVLTATGPGAAGRVAAQLRRWGLDPAGPGGAAGTDPLQQWADPARAWAVGDARAVADAVRRWADAGADTVVLQPTDDDPDPQGFVRFVAAEVRPLVP
jgi:alkanesulfonate monooxygenase SsuD/methylene tetrahydromethanopterin reductase-like flavin-dependent oxidoreductase (luciferase family)